MQIILSDPNRRSRWGQSDFTIWAPPNILTQEYADNFVSLLRIISQMTVRSEYISLADVRSYLIQIFFSDRPIQSFDEAYAYFMSEISGNLQNPGKVEEKIRSDMEESWGKIDAFHEREFRNMMEPFLDARY
ncbi:MAG: hypothetical protein UV36_C0005G0006 [Parcubacteria group bacterium GW2011_GWC2_42_6]|nr:MAG: hypothetical protein UV36_C0005G0006 [Parcubacteria group bacterium GW2011_GWC2_42_6]KKT76720.1 MAG: hypothetical protein UW72_C0002G0022 [Parcubacteria group bacterium GW2011_GWF2_44_7]